MHIETFKGRKGKYNKSILKALYERGYLSGWKIAKEIVMNDPKRRKRNWYHETQKVYSVLVRKGGTLKRLLSKEFIENTDQGYCLTIYKGLCSALTLYDNVREPAINELSKTYEIFPELKEAQEIISRLYPETIVEQYKAMLKTTEELLDQGWNIDAVSNRQFNRIFHEQFQETLLRVLKERRGSGEEWEPNPELQELTLRFLDRMRKILLESVKTLDNEFASFKGFSRKHSKKERRLSDE